MLLGNGNPGVLQPPIQAFRGPPGSDGADLKGDRGIEQGYFPDAYMQSFPGNVDRGKPANMWSSERGHPGQVYDDRSEDYRQRPREYEDVHQSPPRLQGFVGSFHPPTPARSPYPRLKPAYSNSNGGDPSFSAQADHPAALSLFPRIVTPPLSPLSTERATRYLNNISHMRSRMAEPSHSNMDGGPGNVNEMGNVSLDVSMADDAAMDYCRVCQTRNIALDNLPVHLSLAELKNFLQAYGDIRHMFRPKQGLYSGVVVMFFDIDHAVNAFKALCNAHLGNRKSITYFVDTDQLQALLYGADLPSDQSVSHFLDNQGEILLSGLTYRDDNTIVNILETYGRVRSLRSFNYGNHTSYAVEFFDTRVARSAFEGLHDVVIQDHPIHVAFPRFIPVGPGSSSLPSADRPMHLPILDNNEQNIGLRRNASSVSVSNMHSEMAHHHRSNSSMEELHYGMAGKPRVWQPLKHRGLKIDTSSSLMRPSPLRRAASENCVTASLARELEHSMHADMSQMSAHNGFPNGRARFAASPTRLAMPKFRIGSPGPRSPVTEVPSPLHPVPPPNEHSIPAANELNLYNIAMGYDTRTTFMIRNIPNKYTQEMLIAFLNRTHKGQFDFLYLRMDFKNRCNVGYAFINFNGSAAVLSFAERVVGKKWSKFNSDKVCTLSYANIQGRNALIQKFRNSSVMLEAHDWRPKIFLTEGPCAGEEEPFPPPTMAIRPRSDVLFSRDNAGLPHRGNSVNEGRGSPRKVSFDDFDGQVGQWPKPSRGDQTCDSPVSRSQSRSSLNSASIDDLDFSKLTLGDDIVPSVVGNEKENGSLQAPPQWGDQPLAGNMSLPGIVDGVSHQQMAASWALS